MVHKKWGYGKWGYFKRKTAFYIMKILYIGFWLGEKIAQLYKLTSSYTEITGNLLIDIAIQSIMVKVRMGDKKGCYTCLFVPIKAIHIRENTSFEKLWHGQVLILSQIKLAAIPGNDGQADVQN